MSNATQNVYDCFINNVQQWARENNIDADAARYEPLPRPVDQAFLGPEYDVTPETYLDKAWLRSFDDAMRDLERGTVVVGNAGHAIAAAPGPHIHTGMYQTVQSISYTQDSIHDGSGFNMAAPYHVPGTSSTHAGPFLPTIPFHSATATHNAYTDTFSGARELYGRELPTGVQGRDTGPTEGTILLDRTNTLSAERGLKVATPAQNLLRAVAPSARAGDNAAGSSTHNGLGPHAQSNQNTLSRNTARAFERLSLGQWAILLHLNPFDADPGAEDTRNEAQSGSKNPKAKTQPSATHTLECSACRADGAPTYHQDRGALKRHKKTHKPVRHFRCTMCAAIVLDRPDRVTEHWGGKCKAYAKLREKGIAWYWAALYGMFDHAQFAGREYLWE